MERRGGGAIVNIATNRVFRGFANLLHYDASKGAVLAMTKAMAAELGEKNIRVNAVAPGLTLSENVLSKTDCGSREGGGGGARLRRSQQPEDLIGAVCFFASAASGFVTGQSLIVDGGGIMQ
jgi:NAD(P)-dependent dehydrogenase (short-subunit alcohol dehydrogenase family)